MNQVVNDILTEMRERLDNVQKCPSVKKQEELKRLYKCDSWEDAIERLDPGTSYEDSQKEIILRTYCNSAFRNEKLEGKGNQTIGEVIEDYRRKYFQIVIDENLSDAATKRVIDFLNCELDYIEDEIIKSFITAIRIKSN
jgi:hypothetical protein